MEELPMKRNQKSTPEPQDNPSTRKRRLQKRLQELSDRSDREMAALMKSVERMKASLRSNKRP